MGIHRGPNPVNDGLTFGCDTGYGVADNNTATRFYPGEPAVNLLNYDNTMPIWPSNSSNMAALTSKTSARSFTVIGTCNVPGSMTFVYPSITTNATYHTISATFTNNSTETSNVALYIRGKDNATSTVSQSQTTTMQPGQSIRKTLIGNVLTVNGGYTAAVGVWSHGTSGQVNMNVTDIQFEEATHATPFVNGTRSSTASLIDLKRTTSIDVSNVSFDSTGQPTFDNSDDRITMPNSSVFNHTSQLTIESWVKFDGNSADFIFEKGNVNTQYSLFSHDTDIVFRTIHAGVSGYHTLSPSKTTAGITNGVWHHIVGSWDGSTKRIYVDGVDKASVSKSGALATNSNGAAIGSFGGTSSGYYFGGEIAIVRIYDKGLSADEVKQNYNAYKNRFNI